MTEYSPVDEPAIGLEYGARRTRRFQHRTSPAAAQWLSFAWPGLGQLYLGHPARGLLLLLPPTLLVAGLIVLAAPSPYFFGLRLLAPTVMAGALLLIAAHGLWRVLAMIDTWHLARQRATGPPRPAAGLPRPAAPDTAAMGQLMALSLVVVLVHAVLGYYVYSASNSAAPIFRGGDNALDEVIGRVPGAPLPATGPINVLFVGVDSASYRTHALTDTIMLTSFDPVRGQVAQVSIPRDTGRLPMYDGTIFRPRINSMVGRARADPARYPDGPLGTLMREVGYLLGVDVHYYAAVDMAGFEQVVDAVGGVDVEVTKPIADPVRKLYIEPGKHHLDGATALSFVRSRFGPNNSDYERARRAQQVIRALGQRAQDPRVVARIPDITPVVAGIVRTNVPIEQLGELLDLVDEANRAETRQVVLRPPKYAQRVPPAEVGGRFMTELLMDEVRALSIELFGEHSHYASGGQP